MARCERLPRPGETLTDAEFERVPGGKGANQAVAAARLGAEVKFIGRIGRDDLVLGSLEREGVDTSAVVRDDGESGVALILVDDGGENVIVVAPGANRRLTADDVDVGDTDAVISQLEISLEAVLAAASQARFFCLNAAPARGRIELEKDPDLLIVNRYEYEQVTSYDGLVALTLGAEGAVLLENGTRGRARRPAAGHRGGRDRRRRLVLRRAGGVAARGPGAGRGARASLRRRRARRVASGGATIAADRRRGRRAADRRQAWPSTGR